MTNHSILSDRAITRGFFLAGAVNVLGMLAISKLFTNPLLSANDPAVFSWLGQVAIILWGLAYWAVAKSFHYVPYLVMVFCVEKMVYTVTWLMWLVQKGDSLKGIAAESPMTANFFKMYGAGDFAFGIFFGWVAFIVFRRGGNSAS